MSVHNINPLWTLILVQVTGLEPAWNCFHMDLNHARLPIPPYLRFKFLPSVFLHGREVRAEAELSLDPRFAGSQNAFASSPTWCNLNHARLPIPPYLRFKLFPLIFTRRGNRGCASRITNIWYYIKQKPDCQEDNQAFFKLIKTIVFSDVAKQDLMAAQAGAERS